MVCWCLHSPGRDLRTLGAGFHRALVRAPDGDPASANRRLLAKTAARRSGRPVAKPYYVPPARAAVAIRGPGTPEAKKRTRGLRAAAGSAKQPMVGGLMRPKGQLATQRRARGGGGGGAARRHQSPNAWAGSKCWPPRKPRRRRAATPPRERQLRCDSSPSSSETEPARKPPGAFKRVRQPTGCVSYSSSSTTA